jgi:probable phosphoglycerate mutase
MQLLLLARHGQSQLNVLGIVNGDPARDPGLSELGTTQAGALAYQLASVALDLCVTSRFPRAQETARLALGGRDLPHVVEEGLDDVRIGELDGRTLADYRAWKHGHTRAERFPGGESLDEAAHRYATAFERLLDRAQDTILCVCHEIPIRYAVNAAGGSAGLDGPIHDVPNAEPYVFDAAGLRRAVDGIRALAAAAATR